tara:strand:+ start:4789 stop:4923 length:135 start_codon:yes stop_codon:yes gene_type:complete
MEIFTSFCLGFVLGCFFCEFCDKIKKHYDNKIIILKKELIEKEK